jgi:hypothetical protein
VLDAATSPSSAADDVDYLQRMRPKLVTWEVAQELGGLLETLSHLSSFVSATSSVTAMAAVGPQLVAFGAALCAAVPSTLCCNNIACTNLAQLSKAKLVGGEKCICSK